MPDPVPNPIDLTSLANVKSWLKITVTDDDTNLARLITACSSWISKSYCRRVFQLAGYVEGRNGTGTHTMMLANRPIVLVESVQVDGISIPHAPDFRSFGWVNDDLAVCLRGHLFTRGVQNVLFTYSAGFTEIPADVEEACIEAVSIAYKERGRIGEQSKIIDGQNVSFRIEDFSPRAQSILLHYKNEVPL
jgi:hypothetical protein